MQAGQVGVAVGRSTDRDGLCIKNYDPKCSKQHPQAVNDYCASSGAPPLEDLSCCRKVCAYMYLFNYYITRL